MESTLIEKANQAIAELEEEMKRRLAQRIIQLLTYRVGQLVVRKGIETVATTKTKAQIEREEQELRERQEEEMRQAVEQRRKEERDILKGYNWLQKIGDDMFEAVSQNYQRRGTIDIARRTYKLSSGSTPSGWNPYSRLNLAASLVYDHTQLEEDE